MQERRRDWQILDSISDMVFIHALDTGAVVYVNQRACEAYGYDAQEFAQIDVGQLSEGSPPYSRAEAQALMGAAAAGTPQRAEWLARRRDGSAFWVEVALRRARLDGVDRVLVTARDIDQRKRTELALAHSEARYRSLYEQVPVSLWQEDWTEIIDAVRSLPCSSEQEFAAYFAEHPDFVEDCLAKVRILDVNPHTLSLFGADSTTQMLDSLQTVFATEDTLPGFVGELVALGEGRRVYHTEMRLNRLDGSVFPVLLTMTFPAPNQAGGDVLVSLIDISDRVAAEEARRREHGRALLEASERKFRGLYESVNEGIAYTSLDGQITDANPAFQQMLGYSLEELQALRFSDFTPKRWQAMEEKIITEQVMARGYSDEYEKEYRRKDGTVFPIRLRAWLVRDEAGEPAGLWGMVRDISEEKRIAAEKERHTRALQAAVDDLEGFSYSVSHDLRAPLRAIDSYAQILVDEYMQQLEPEAARMLGVVRRNAQKLARLIEDLLAFSRAGRRDSQRQWVDMDALCRSVLAEQLQDGPEHKVEFTMEALPPAWGDPAALHQVLSNYLGNALKFTAGREQARIHVAARRSDDETCYTVRDNGAGFDAQYADKLFQVFTRLHGQEEFPGTGMGLAIVRRLITKHNGRVWAESTAGEGTCFGFALPLPPTPHREESTP